MTLTRRPFASAAGRTRFDGAADELAQIDARDVEPQAAARHRRQIQQLLDQLHLRRRVALDRFQDRLRAIGRHGSAAQHARPAEHGVERRAQLV